MSARQYGQHTPKNLDQIRWARDKARIQTEAQLLMNEALDLALQEAAMLGGICGHRKARTRSSLSSRT